MAQVLFALTRYPSDDSFILGIESCVGFSIDFDESPVRLLIPIHMVMTLGHVGKQAIEFYGGGRLSFPNLDMGDALALLFDVGGRLSIPTTTDIFYLIYRMSLTM